MILEIVVRKVSPLFLILSMQRTILSCFMKSSCRMLMLILTTGVGVFLVIFPFNELMSGPKTCSVIAMSFCIIGLFVMRFIQMMALKSASDGVPRA
jgi:hypothetical protein